MKMLMLVMVRLSRAKLKFWWHHLSWFKVYFLLHFSLGFFSYQFKIYKWLIYVQSLKPGHLLFYYQNTGLHLRERVCIWTEISLWNMKSYAFAKMKSFILSICLIKALIFDYFGKIIHLLWKHFLSHVFLWTSVDSSHIDALLYQQTCF